MQQKLDALKTQLKAVEAFETLFQSTNPNDYAKDNAAAIYAQANLAFGNMKFDEADNRHDFVQESTALIKSILDINSENFTINSAYDFFNLVGACIASYKKDGSQKEKNILALRKAVTQLISTQKEFVSTQLETASLAAKAEAEAEATKKLLKIRDLFNKLAYSPEGKKLVQDKMNDNKKAARIALAKKVGVGALGTTGLVATLTSGALYFSPQFAMMVGVHLPVVALASIAVAGLAMTAVAAYLTYRAYKATQAPVANADVKNDATTEVKADAAPVVVNSNRAAMVNYGIIGSGVSLAAFAGALQFSPQFALMLGANLSPVALAGIAAVGVLMLSIGLYRMCKARAQTPANDTTTEVKDAAPTVTFQDRVNHCVNRIAQYTPACCFRLFSRGGDTGAAAATQAHDNSMTVNVTK